MEKAIKNLHEVMKNRVEMVEDLNDKVTVVRFFAGHLALIATIMTLTAILSTWEKVTK